MAYELKVRCGLGCMNLVDLGSQDEIAFCQTIDFVGPDGDLNSSPSQKDVRMVTLLFREIPNLIDKFESPAKIGKLQSFCDVVLLDHVPSVHLLLQRGEFLAL